VRAPSGKPVPLDDIEIAGPHVAANGRATLLVLIDGADLALLHVETDAGPPAARFGDSTRLEAGDLVFSASELSVRDPLTTGVVVGEIRRQLANATLRYLETTLPVAAAPPGAPVFNAHGDVVGVAAAAQSPDGSPLVLRIEDVKRVLLPLAGDR
jgi:S1-C subfamily serine protease